MTDTLSFDEQLTNALTGTLAPTVPKATEAPQAEAAPAGNFDSALKEALGVGTQQAPVAPVSPSTPQDLPDDEDTGALQALFAGVGQGGRNLKTTAVELSALPSAFSGDQENLEAKVAVLNARAKDYAIRRESYTQFDEAFDSVPNFLEWSAFTLGEQVPNMVGIITGGLLGKVVAQAVVKGTISATIGTAIGAYATASGIETGATLGEQANELDIEDIDPKAAVIAGMAKGALESMTPLALGRLGGVFHGTSDDFAGLLERAISSEGGRLARGTKGFVKGGLREGATELSQEYIDIMARIYVDEEYAGETDAQKDRLIESFVSALVAGGGITAAVSALPGTPDAEISDTSDAEISDTSDIEEIDFTSTTEPVEVEPGVGGDVTSVADLITDKGQLTKPIGVVESQDRDDLDDLIYSTPKSNVANPAGFMEFLPESEAFYASALLKGGGDAKNLMFLQAKSGAFEESSITADLASIPETVVGNKNVSWIGEVNQKDQKQILARVVNARKLLARQPTKAKEIYQEAVEAGFRFTPQQGGGVLAITPPKVGSVVVRDQVFTPQYSPRGGTTVDLQQKTMFDGVFTPLTTAGARRLADTLEEGPVVSETQVTPGTYRRVKGQDFTVISIGDLTEVWGRSKEAALKNMTEALESGKIRAVFPKGVTLKDVLAADTFEYQTMVKQGLRIVPQDAPAINLMAVGALRKEDLIFAAELTASDVTPSSSSANDAKSWMRSGYAWETGEEFNTMHGKVAEPRKVSFLYAPDLGVKQKRRAAVLSKVVTALHKKFLPNIALTVTFHDGFSVTTANGWHMGFAEDQSSVIALDIRDPNMGKLIPTLAHEFGHAISTHYMYNAVKKGEILASEVMSAYERWQFRMQQVGLADQAMSEGFSSRRNHTLYKGIVTESQAAMPQLNKYAPYTIKNYLYEFEEWIAEQMAQAVEINSVTGTGKLERLFKALSKRMASMYRMVYNKAKRDTPQFRDQNSAFAALQEYLDTGNPRNQSMETTIRNLQNNQAVWVESIGAEVQESDVSVPVKRMLEHPRMSKVLKSKTEDGKTLGEKLKETQYEAGHFNAMVKWGWNVLQLAQKNPKIAFLQAYVDLAELWQNEKNTWQSRANETLREWSMLSKKRSDNFARFLFAIDSMEYLGPKAAARFPNTKEMQKLLKKYNMDRGMFKLYQRVKGDFHGMLSRMEQVLVEQVREADPSVVGQIEIARIQKEFKELRNRPYFPHARFGNWSVIVSNQQGKPVHVEFVEVGISGKLRDVAGKIPKEVQKLQAALQKNYGPDHNVGISQVEPHMQSFTGMPTAVLRLIKDKLGGSLTKDEVQWLEQISIDFVPAQSFRKHFKKRTNRAGYSQDAMRAYADYFWHGSNHLARVSFGTRMGTVIEDFRKDNSKKTRMGLDVANRTKMTAFLEDHLQNILNPKPDWAQMRSFAFTWWLGFSVASATLNFTQLPMVTLPYLSSRFGDLKAANAMRKAALDLRKMYTDPVTMAKKWNPQDARLMELGLQQNFLEENLAQNLAGVAEGGNLVRLRQGSAMQRGMTKFAEASGWMFQGSEKINRRITFNAAIRMARENPNTPYLAELQNMRSRELQSLIQQHGLSKVEATAFLAGKDAVQRTQFEYGAWAKPRFMRGKKGVVFTFWMFLQNMLWAVGNSPGNKRILITMLAMGGIMGLPGAEDLFAVADAIGKKIYGKYWKTEEEIAKLLIAILGSNRAADNVLHGAGREGFGLNALGDLTGMPIPAFDMSGSVGMGTVVPGLQAILKGADGNFESMMGRAATDIAGASFGIAINMVKFLTDTQLPIDDAKRWERAMPRALKNVTRSMRYLPEDVAMAKLTGAFVEPEGRERTRTGATVFEFNGSDAEHLAEIAFQGMGFSITRANREWNEVIARAEVERYWAGRRGMLLTQYWHTLYTDDPDARKDVLRAVRAFNKILPFGEMGISSESLRDSRKARTRTMLLQQNKVATTKRFRRLGQATGELYPTEDDVVNVEVTR